MESRGATEVYGPTDETSPALLVRQTGIRAESTPMPLCRTNKTQFFDCLLGSMVFFSLELHKGYWYIPLAEGYKEMDIFACRFGIYPFQVMSFGHMNSQSMVRRMMDQILAGLYFTRVYFVFFVKFPGYADEHLRHLETVLELVHSYGMRLKVSNFHFVKERKDILGYIIESDSRVSLSPEKLVAVQGFETADDATVFRSFLGIAGS